jgi:hypothetical protein
VTGTSVPDELDEVVNAVGAADTEIQAGPLAVLARAEVRPSATT